MTLGFIAKFTDQHGLVKPVEVSIYIQCLHSLFDNIGYLVPPVSVFWYRQFTLSDFSYRLSGTAPDAVH